MSWMPRNPMPADFCGRPPCPKCYAWAGGDEPQSLAQFAFELLGRQANRDETREAKKIAAKLHKEGLSVTRAPDKEPPSDTGATFVDIGMGSVEYQTRWLREQRRNAPLAARRFTCDEVADRQADRDARAKAKQKERQERLKDAREVAQVFADAQKDQQRRQEREEQYYLKGVDPGFVDYCRSRGISDLREIAMRWQREYGSSVSARYMADPYSKY